MASSCEACPRKCGVPRPFGYCGVGENIKISRTMVHMWEEPCISGTKGSGAIFFSGCNLSCVYCQNYKITSLHNGYEITPDKLRELYFELIDLGVHNINLVTPSHFVNQIAQTLSTRLPVPIVYNSSGYEGDIDILNGLCDIYLVDIKYGDNNVAKKYSDAANYIEICLSSLEKMYSQVGDYVIENGIMKQGIVVRHLVLPSNIDSSLDAIDLFCKFSKGKKVKFSLMSQYIPCGRAADFPEINRKISPEEYDRVLRYVQARGITDGYMQDINSADTVFIPEF